MGFTYFSTGRTPLAFRMENLSVFFSDEKCLKIITKVLDEDGRILNHPGILEDERWISKQRIGIPPDVRFEALFYAIDNGKFLMLWTIQPSGWHWVDDDGFGFSGDSSITLYSVIDENGEFTKKFELFRINNTIYCHDFDQYR